MGTTTTASAPVAALTAREALPGVRWNSAASCGRTGWGA